MANVVCVATTGCCNSSREAGKLHVHVRAAVASMSGIGKRTEQVGRSATDCVPTSDAAKKACSRKKHFIVKEILFCRASAKAYLRQVIEMKENELQVGITHRRKT